jgi:RNA recognition motif-containing protein
LNLNITGASAGYGFVKYTADEGAHKALSALNGFQLNGKTLKVSIARPMHQKNEKTTLYVAGSSHDCVEWSRSGACLAFNSTFTHRTCGWFFCVPGIPLTWSKNDFELMFRQYGNVTESKILQDTVGASRGVGFITMESSASANAALGLNNTQPPGFDKPMQVKIKLPHAASNAAGMVRSPSPSCFPWPQHIISRHHGYLCVINKLVILFEELCRCPWAAWAAWAAWVAWVAWAR